MIGCLRTRVHKQPIIALYFESENVLKLYNFEARVSNDLDLDQDQRSVTVCKGYQQMTKLAASMQSVNASII